MVTYTVHEPPNPPADRLDRAQALEFLKDGFNGGAAVLGPLWLLTRRAWIGLGIYLAGLTVVVTALMALGAGAEWITLAVIAVHVVVGFEASELERSQKESDGWVQLGSVEGRTEIECERRFFDAWLPLQPMIARGGAAAAPQPVGAISANPRPRGLLSGLTDTLGWKTGKA